ncbi:Basic-leucine zipper domain [Trinorchestia longiramus]|nr:Basic-leucine zipper domain [Trinorchestia longiramus]
MASQSFSPVSQGCQSNSSRATLSHSMQMNQPMSPASIISSPVNSQILAQRCIDQLEKNRCQQQKPATMAHESPRPPISLRGSRPCNPEDPRSHTALQVQAGALHSSLGSSSPFLNSAPQHISLEIEEPSAGIVAGGSHHNNSSNQNTSIRDSFCTNSQAASLQHDELNTPDIVPLAPFQFPSTSDSDSIFNEFHLMDTILSASREDEEKEAAAVATRTKEVNSALITSAAAQQLDTVKVCSGTVLAQVPVQKELSTPNSIIINGIAYNIVSISAPMAQPTSELNTTAAMVTNTPCRSGLQQAPVENITSEDSTTLCNRSAIIDEPQSTNLDQASLEKFGISCNSVSMTDGTCGVRPQAFLDWQSSDGKGSNIERADLCTPNDPVREVTSFYCATDVSSSNSFPPQLDLNVHSSWPTTNINTQTTMQSPANESPSCIGSNQTEETFLYSCDGLPDSVGNLDEMNEAEMKEIEDFWKNMLNDGDDLSSTELDLQVNSNSTAQSSSMTELDHLSLLIASQEPGQLITSKFGEQNESFDQENRLVKSNINCLNFSNETLKSELVSNIEGPKVRPWVCENITMNLLPGDPDNFGSPAGSNNVACPSIPTRHVLNEDPDLNGPALTSLRRPSATRHNNNALDNEKLKEKLQLHLQTTTSHEYSENVPCPADVVRIPSDHAPNVVFVSGVGRDREQTPDLPVTQPNPFILDFDPALKVPCKAASQISQSGCTIKVSVLKNKSSLRSPQKPLKRLASSEAAPGSFIRTKIFKKVPNSSNGPASVVPTPVASSSEGVGQEACIKMPRNIPKSILIHPRNETPGNYDTGYNMHSGTPGNTLGVKLPAASTSAPRCFVVVKPTRVGSPAKAGGQISNSLIKMNTGNNSYLTGRFGDSSGSISNPVPRAAKAQTFTAVDIVSTTSKCSLSYAPASSTAAVGEPVSRLSVISVGNVSSQPRSSGAGLSCFKSPAGTSDFIAQDKTDYDSADDVVLLEAESGFRYGQARAARGETSVVGFSRLPRSEQLALDAEKYRKNLKANNIASTRSRLKKKTARLALEGEVEFQAQLRVDLQRRFEMLKSQFDVMNKIVEGRPCCPYKK